MKRPHLFLLPLLFLSPVHAATTVTWRSLAASELVDSSGTLLAQSSFTFQLGTFLEPFTPSATNTGDWASNWVVFDQAIYTTGTFGPITYGEFSGSAGILENGTSDSIYADPVLAFDFQGKQAYIWVYNTTSLSNATEWFLVTHNTWLFPEGTDEPTSSFDVEWTLGDLGSETPIWGSQQGNNGAGEYESTSNTFNLQTFTGVPEPSSLVLCGMGVWAWGIRRKRED